MRRIAIVVTVVTLAVVTTAWAFEVRIPRRTNLKATVVANELGTVLFDTVPGKVEVTNPMGGTDPGLRFSQVRLITSADDEVTVPVETVWEIVGVNGAQGETGSSALLSNHCGSVCAEGLFDCGESSCKYEGFIWELNGIPIGRLQGCFVCSGSDCAAGGFGSIANCPSALTLATSNPGAVVSVPFWLNEGTTLKLNATNTLLSVLEYVVVP